MAVVSEFEDLKFGKKNRSEMSIKLKRKEVSKLYIISWLKHFQHEFIILFKVLRIS